MVGNGRVENAVFRARSPRVNGYNESFNGTLGDDTLKREIFYTLEDAQIIIEQWRKEYGRITPHSSLGYRDPAPQAAARWLVPEGGTDFSG